MSQTSVSLLIPAYNSQRWLGDLLADARQQTQQFCEVLVYDDASSDGTAAIATEWGARVIRGTENRGAGYGRNRLLEAAKGEYVHFHDADDRMDPQFNERMHEVLQRQGAASSVICGARHVDMQTGLEMSQAHWVEVNRQADQLAYFLRTQCAMIVGVYPRELVRAVGGFREDIRGGEDYAFHIGLAEGGARFHAIPDVLCTIRHFGGESFTERHTHQYLLDNLDVVTELASRLGGKYPEQLSFVAIDLAWRLFDHGDRAAADLAQQLARRLGRREISTNSEALRVLSRWIGFGLAFRIRKLTLTLRSVTTVRHPDAAPSAP